VEIDELKIILSIPTDLNDGEQQEVIASIVRGFKKSAALIKCKLTIESVGLNPWCLIGGIATSICTKEEIIFPTKAQAGDVLILTKPLGVQLATNAPIWMEEDSENWRKIREHLTREEVLECYEKAVKSMTSLNRTAAELMHKHKAHAATDVTGFGLVGHAENLLSFQQEKLDFIISKLPVIRHVKKIAEVLGRHQKLYNGKMVETSGGLLVALPHENAQNFCDDFAKISGFDCWIVGQIVAGTGKVQVENPEIVEV
jgi:selenide, water dikinase